MSLITSVTEKEGDRAYEVLTAFDGDTCHDGKVGRVEGIQTHDRDDVPASLITLHNAAPAASTLIV
jgi:hypothetical protein